MKYLSFPGYKTSMGLGNRLFCLVGDMMLATEFYFVDFSIYWDSNYITHKAFNEITGKRYFWKTKKYPFQDLFETNFEILTEIPKDDYLIINRKNAGINNRRPYVNDTPVGIVQGFPILKNEVQLIKNVKSYQEEFNGTTAFCFDKLPIFFQEKFIKYFKLLKPSKKVLEKMNNYLIDKNTIGVHIRRGDFLHYNIKKYNRTGNTIDKYTNYIEKDKRIFLCTDCDETETEFKKIYGDRVFTFETKKEIRDEMDALCMILLLSKCKTLLLSNYSSFSELAWWFGECQAKVHYIK